MIKVLIADDHQMLIDGIKAMLAQEKDIVVAAEAVNGIAVLEYLKKSTVDIILMDVNMPKMDGIDTCKEVKIKFPAVKVLALTMFDEGSFITGMLKNGAEGYILKNTGREELVTAIKTIHAGGTYFSEQVKQSLMTSMMPGKKVQPSSFLPKLTSREKEILKLIVKEYNTKEIADALFISLNTVETHRKHLISKLNVRNSAGLVRIAIERGLLD